MSATAGVPWKCFECGKVVTVVVAFHGRDGSLWSCAPSGWIFVNDDELTHVCSVACLERIYERTA